MTAHLAAPQYVYLGAVGCYFLFFTLFLRLFWWKRYADRHFWRRRPTLTIDGISERSRALGQPLPRFSIMVPARNEADVIERTVEHMLTLEYPTDLYEVVVVTDEKEARAAALRREEAVRAAALALRGRSAPPGPETEAGSLTLALLGELSLETIEDVRRRIGSSEGLQLLRHVPDHLLRPLLWESAQRLLRNPGKRLSAYLYRRLRVRLPSAGEEELQGAYAALLSLAIPTSAAFCRLRGGDGRALAARLATMAARAHHSLTREIILAMCESLAAALMTRLEQAGSQPDLEQRLEGTFREIFPTTQDILERKVREMAGRSAAPELKHVVVPSDFDGLLGGTALGFDVPSTKGRALNRGLAYIDGRTTWCGFYDAESRPHAKSMLYVAHRLLQAKASADAEPAPRIFQGPVFQVRNWYDMGPFCKIASLYQAIAHDWYLPALFRRLPFVGGTNLYIEARLLREIGGYDSSSLTEDLELGTRAYLAAGAWPEYLPYPSSEQTPPTFAGFYRQRLRWATGHLQVMAKVKAEPSYDEVKRKRLLRELWRKGQGEWIFYQAATLVPPVIVVLWFFNLVDPNVLGTGWHVAMNLLSTVYLGFTIYAFFRYLEHLDQTGRPRRWMGQLGALAQLLVLPLAAFLFPVPYSSALVLATLGRGPSQWVKTPRTRE